jgi:two-component system LytT family response regulator
MTNRAWRVIIVDDEPLARQTLRLLLTRETDFVLAGESTHAKSAIEAIDAVRPDVVFLDVHMPELDGFAVVPHLDPASPPLVVFVTAFERHALKAFEAQAFDYLLKPFTDERFADVARRLRGRLREREHLRTSPAPARTLLVRDGTRTLVVPHDDIVWIEAEDYCARIHLRDRTLLVRESLRSLVDELSGAGFVRVHRSAIVRLAAIRAMVPLSSGDQSLTLSNGRTLRVSRTYRTALVKALPARVCADRR